MSYRNQTKVDQYGSIISNMVIEPKTERFNVFQSLSEVEDFNSTSDNFVKRIVFFDNNILTSISKTIIFLQCDEQTNFLQPKKLPFSLV